ncbi:acyl-CoA dehydrogenase [Intrasporangium sp.]|uniref:acyl-CoA dehydrogenase n=1 Tax=Intrasporangium sp. TaxID=1925024 RepID=UPI003221B666
MTMTFRPTEDQGDLQQLVASIVAGQTNDESVAAIDATAGAWDEGLHEALVASGVVEAVVGEHDEPGLGMAGLYLALLEAGRAPARVPLASTAVAGLVLARAGHPAAARIAAGEVTVAISTGDPLHALRVVGDRLEGTLGIVYAAQHVSHLLLADEGGALHLVAADHEGVELRPAGLGVDGATGRVSVPLTELDVIPGVTLADVLPRLRTALAALATGAAAEAVRRTADYVSHRVQFGQPLSTKQGVAIRAADAHIDTESMRLATMRAAVAIDEEQPDAAQAATEAAWWVTTAGVRAVHAAQHLHGGMGADVDNHIHRYFVLVRDIAIALGAADALLAEIGDAVVAGKGVLR